MMQKKASESSNRSDIGKKCQTHEDRCNYYDRFLKPVKETVDAVMKGATVVLAAQAVLGLGEAHAISTSDAPSTTLARTDGDSRDGNNAMALHLDQKGQPHLANQTNLEHNLSKVTPELLEYLEQIHEKSRAVRSKRSEARSSSKHSEARAKARAKAAACKESSRSSEECEKAV